MTLQQRTPLRAKREKPRRDKHPVQPEWAMEQNRVKDTKKRPPNAAESRHIARVVALGCVVCGKPAHYHHERNACGGKRDHRFGVPLCPWHHTDGPDARHKTNVLTFLKTFGVNLVEKAVDFWMESQRIEAKRKTGE